MESDFNRSDIHKILDKLSIDEKRNLIDFIIKDIEDILGNTRGKGYVNFKQPTIKSE